MPERSPKIPQKTSLAVHGIVADEPLAIRIVVPSIVFTIESAVARAGKLTLDRSNILVASRETITIASDSASTIAIVGFHDLEEVDREYRALGFDRPKLARWMRRASLLPRTVWVHELLHRYVFERHALDNHDNLATRFLEIELAKELFFLFRDRDERPTIVHTHSTPIESALRYIEAHITDEIDLAVLARVAGASKSTLLRAFHAELGCSPGALWRNRKLDEALLWLRGGRTVADVAARAGYENPTAFGFAFRRRFGRPPSSFRPASSGSRSRS